MLQKSQILIVSPTSSKCKALAPRSIQTAKVISHTKAFNYVCLNGSCLASRMTSRLNNRTIRALSGADGNTTWYLLNAPPSACAHTRTPHTLQASKRMCVSVCFHSCLIHSFETSACSVFIFVITARLKIQSYVFHRLITRKNSSSGTTEGRRKMSCTLIW